MKKLLVSFLAVLIFLVVVSTVPANAEKCCVCIEGIELLMEGQPFNPPRIEKLQILGILKKKDIKVAIINFINSYNPLRKSVSGLSYQIDVEIVTENGDLFKGSLRVSKNYLKKGLVSVVRDALKSRE